MKTRYIVIATALIVLGLSSCNEALFLDNPPQGTVSEDVLMTPEGANQLCMAAYAALMGPNPQDWGVWWMPVTHWTTGSVRSDDAYKGGGGTGDGWETHRLETFTLDSTDGVTDSKWYHLCVSIQRCNSALRVLQNCSDSQIFERKCRIAEMKVLRAHFFFELQRMFNLIPWYDETMDDQTVQTTPNNVFSREELLDKIADEIREALEYLPQTQPEKGRVNLYMAKAYLAKVLLYRAYEQDAKTHSVVKVNKEVLAEVISLCKEIRENPMYSLFDDFQDLDLVSNDNGKECIWDIQYSMNDGSASAGRINWSHLLNTPQGPYNGDGFFLPSQDLINAYQTDQQGLPVFDYQSLPDFASVQMDNEKAIITNYDHNVDPRLDFVVGRPNIRWKSYEQSPYLAQWVRNRGDYGVNSSKRFVVSPESSDMYQGWPWGASALNWHMIRYAHILLWEAEALIECGEVKEGIKLINEVRQRAADSDYVRSWTDATQCFGGTCPDFEGYAANYKIGLYPEEISQELARQAVRTESRLEFAMEGERFFDLVRWGIAEQTMNAFFEAENDNRVYYQGVSFTAGKDEYLPITNNQYKFSGRNYVQNPGYGEF
ncbi:MAG: RagB/SusD family nutrient uptake outer membrane protein [Candidatus Cryptobacteroides sp.]